MILISQLTEVVSCKFNKNFTFVKFIGKIYEILNFSIIFNKKFLTRYK